MPTVLNLFCLFLAVIAPLAAQTALDQYVQKPDANYSWEVYANSTDAQATVDTYFVRMVSQQWRSTAEVDRPLWQHELIISVPRFAGCSYSGSMNTAVLLIDGGSNPQPGEFTENADDILTATTRLLCMVVAQLKQVPNQPLNFSDENNAPRKEDEILAYSFDKFLDTADPEWPVHLAMTKAAVRAMDTVQAVTQQHSPATAISDFIVTGASKRGWTTWLTGAVDDRVRAIIPISIDLPNLRRQFVHHWESYGFFAAAIDDYTAFDIGCRLRSSRGQELLAIVDPYAYRDRYTMPKLIVNSAGDQFFTSDSSRFYYDALPAPKHLRYTPNTDHSQGGGTGIEAMLLNLIAWIGDIRDGDTPPGFDWSFAADGSIRVQTTTTPHRVSLWQANNPNARDFRLESLGAVWTESALSDSGGGLYIGAVTPPAQGFTGFFVEVEFDDDAPLGATQVFTTGVRIIPDVLPFAGTVCDGIFRDGFETAGG